MAQVAIVGTRSPDESQIRAASMLACTLSRDHGIQVSTGGQPKGIDGIVMRHVAPVEKLKVVLPWPNAWQNVIPQGCLVEAFDQNDIKFSEWVNSVRTHHPAPDRLTAEAFCLHARNYGIVWDRDLVIAFPDSSGEGGTGQAIRVSRALGIPVIVKRRGLGVDAEALLDTVKAMLKLHPST